MGWPKLKPTYDAYSKGMLGLKAGLLAPLVSIIPSFCVSIHEDYRKSLITIFSAFCIFGVDVAFNYLASVVNTYEVEKRKKKIISEMCELEACLQTSNGDHAYKKRVNTKISKLKEEQLNLISS